MTKLLGYYDSLKIANSFIDRLNELGIKEFRRKDLPEDMKRIQDINCALRHKMIEICDKEMVKYENGKSSIKPINVYKIKEMKK